MTQEAADTIARVVQAKAEGGIIEALEALGVVCSDPQSVARSGRLRVYGIPHPERPRETVWQYYWDETYLLTIGQVDIETMPDERGLSMKIRATQEIWR